MGLARSFAAGWTVFTMLAAPALLVAQEPAPESAEPPAAEQPAEAEPAPPPEPEPQPAEPAPEPEQAQQEPAPAPPPPPAEPAPAEPVAPEPAEPRAKKPRARTAASAGVTIKDFSFVPASVTVNAGDTVTWTNSGPSDHTATGDGFDTGLLSQGQSGSATFDSAGTFSYICTPHPFMKGTVVVQAASSDQGDAGAGTAGQEDGSAGTGSTATTTDDGSGLPNSGSEAWALALLGTGLLSLGFAVRRRAPAGN